VPVIAAKAEHLVDPVREHDQRDRDDGQQEQCGNGPKDDCRGGQSLVVRYAPASVTGAHGLTKLAVPNGPWVRGRPLETSGGPAGGLLHSWKQYGPLLMSAAGTEPGIGAVGCGAPCANHPNRNFLGIGDGG
jgi:hypothetical protein